MSDIIKILIIEPDQQTSKSLANLLAPLNTAPEQIKSWDERPELDQSKLPYDVIVLGPSQAFDNHWQWLQKTKITNPQISILGSCANTGPGRDEITFPFPGLHCYSPDLNQADFYTVVEQALMERQDSRLWKDMPVIIGNSQEINGIRKKIKQIAVKDIAVLITGETGTGKELIARSLHFYSQRRHGPLIKINCGSLPDELLESEVFGFQKGAFTGAHRDKPGRFELSHQGTLFIDEVGNLSLPLQAKFLQVLEEKSFFRLGGIEDQTVDTRVVAATNSDLAKMVRQGTFRKDLYFRLNIINIKAWPLKVIKDDIPLMVHFLFDKFCFELKREVIKVPDEIMERMQAYHWPGNVRELETAVRRAIVYKSWDFFTEEMSDNQIEANTNGTGGHPDLEKTFGDLANFFKSNDYALKRISKNYLAGIEKKAILESLNQTDWNRREAAKLLGVSYKTLLNRITELNLSH